MPVIITNMDMPKGCYECPLREDHGWEGDWCAVSEGCDLIGETTRPSYCPLKSLDDAIDDIQTNINSMKENAKLHEKGIRQNGEMIAAGLQMALDIIDSYCKENTDES